MKKITIFIPRIISLISVLLFLIFHQIVLLAGAILSLIWEIYVNPSIKIVVEMKTANGIKKKAVVIYNNKKEIFLMIIPTGIIVLYKIILKIIYKNKK